jgi:alkylresorcinol/alkylpyrone synthase
MSLATGVPERCYSQEEIYADMLQPMLGSNPRARAIFENIGVGYRHVAVDGAYYDRERGTQERNERYLSEALLLGEETVRRCLDAAGLAPEAVDDFIVVSCTGIDIPGLDLRLAGRLGMRPDLQRTCVLGMGCYGAFPGLRRAHEAVIARPGRLALVLALELCSLHLQRDDSTENVVSAALFADGAAAALIRGESGPHDRAHASPPGWPRLLDFATYSDYQTFDHMAFQLTDNGFRMRLSAYVPDLLAAQIEDFVEVLLARHRLARQDIRFWGVHPGSAKILDYTAERLGLTDEQLAASRAVLYRYGNMSSVTVLFVLDEIQRCAGPTPGDYGVLMAFGPGLTLESALVRW